MVKNAIKNMFLMGIGAASITRKKAEETIRVFVSKGVIDNRQAREVISKVMNEAAKAKNKLRKEGVKEIKRVRKKIGEIKKRVVGKASNAANKAARKIARNGMKL